jgi:hypothetical protein
MSDLELVSSRFNSAARPSDLNRAARSGLDHVNWHQTLSWLLTASKMTFVETPSSDANGST